MSCKTEQQHFLLYLILYETNRIAKLQFSDPRWNITMFCVSNCGNANQLGTKPVRREVDHNQGSKGDFLQQCWLVFKPWGFWLSKPEKAGPGWEALSLFCGLFLLWIKSNRTSVVDGAASNRLHFERWTTEYRPERAERTETKKIFDVVANYSSCHCVSLGLSQILIPYVGIWLLDQRVALVEAISSLWSTPGPRSKQLQKQRPGRVSFDGGVIVLKGQDVLRHTGCSVNELFHRVAT